MITTRNLTILAGVTTAGLAAYWLYNEWTEWQEDHQTTRVLIDNFADDNMLLPTECLENGMLCGTATPVVPTPTTINPPLDASVTEPAQAESCTAIISYTPMQWFRTAMSNVTAQPAVAVPVVSQTTVLETELFKERRHRRVGTHKRENYLKTIIAEIKAKMGTPENKEANRMVIRRLARGFMDTHGLRPTQQAAYMETIIEMVLTPGDEELRAHRMTKRSYLKWRRNRGINTWWSWFTGTSAN